ncbi:hypothetical protein CASFOL_009673 [Castilleja foliolosa]|uniref:Myb-like domain-containing protein n=1 Tax=Castilleja foliolosa TaxID=1961234 RepID=A0ABD3DQX7_9LAMI
MAATGRRVVALGGKGSSLTSSSVFDASNGVARITIDSSALSRRSTSSNPATTKFPFSVPNYFTAEETRASLVLLANKLLLSSSPSAASQLLEILEQGVHSSDYTLNDVALDDLALLDFSVAAIDGVSAILDHRSTALSSIADAVAAISCEALRVDVTPFNLMDSGDGSSAKDAVAVASDFKVFFNGSKLVNAGQKLSDSSVTEIPSLHGNFREVSRWLHSKVRVQLNSGFRAGSAKDMSTALSSLALSLSNLGDIGIRRAKLLLANSISDVELCTLLSETLAAKCPNADALEELLASLQAALIKKDYLLFLHNIYELMDIVGKIVSCEGIAAFVSLEGSEIFAEKNNVSVDDNKPSSGDNVHSNKKSEKKKKVVLGKGTSALIQFIKDRMLLGATKADLEKFTQDFVSLLDPRGFGFDDLLMKVKEIVESNESRRLPKLPKNTNERLTKSTWNVKEDVTLMSSWISVSEDKKQGKFQRTGSFWGKVLKKYEEAQIEDPEEINERNIESLKGRFTRLNKNAQKWIAANIEAHRRVKSGTSQLDMEKEVYQLYEGKFTDLYVFNEVMSKVPKWELKLDQDSRSRAYDDVGNKESGGSTKRTKTSADGEYFSPTNVETLDSGGSAVSRPTGREQAKKKKEKIKAPEFSPEVVAELRALRHTRDSEVQVFNRLGRQDVEIEKMKMKHSLLMALLAKDHLSQNEEDLKHHLFNLFKYFINWYS